MMCLKQTMHTPSIFLKTVFCKFYLVHSWILCFIFSKFSFDTFLVTAPIVYALKIPDNKRFSDVTKGYEMRAFPGNGLRLKLQKHPSRGVPRKKCSENMQEIYWRTPITKCDFNKAAKQLSWNLTLTWVLCCNFAAYF